MTYNRNNSKIFKYLNGNVEASVCMLVRLAIKTVGYKKHLDGSTHPSSCLLGHQDNSNLLGQGPLTAILKV